MSLTRSNLMNEEAFRLPQSSYGELVKIIKGYSATNGECSPDDVQRLTGIHSTNISRNNAFLAGIGIITGGKKKITTEKGKSLGMALEHDMPEEIMSHWREIVQGNDFLEKLLTAVRIRKGMDHGTLQSHIAYSAGQPKTPQTMAGAAAVIDILRAANCLKEEDGKLVSVGDESSSRTEQIESSKLTSHGALTAVVSPQVVSSPFSLTATGTPISIQVQIQVQCTPDDLETLALKLQKLISEISQQPASRTGE